MWTGGFFKLHARLENAIKKLERKEPEPPAWFAGALRAHWRTVLIQRFFERFGHYPR